MNIKHLSCIFLCAFVLSLFSACSEKEVPEELPQVKIKLIAENNKIAPLEKLALTVSPGLDVLSHHFDSLVWDAKGTYWDGIVYIGGGNPKGPNDFYFTDYEFGKHSIRVNAYKDGKIVDQDAIDYEVIKPSGDFLNVKWGEENQLGSADTYRTFAKPVVGSEYEEYTYISLSLYYAVDKNYAILKFEPTHVISRGLPDIESIDWFDDNYSEGTTQRGKFEYEFLHEFLVGIYGVPKFVYEGNDVTQTTLFEEYNKRFTYNNDSKLYPVEIWDTPTSSICLMTYVSHIRGEKVKSFCWAIAQPKGAASY